MNRSFLTASAILVLILLVSVVPVLAGGWATITLDAWPAQISANEPVVIGFIVRQHGRDESRLAGLSPTITVKNTASGESFIVQAKDEGAVGHYVATVIFPAAGAWSWSIQAFSMDQPLPDLIVSTAIEKPPAKAELSITPAITAGLLGVAILCMALGVVWRKRARWALALVLVGLLVASVGIASAATQSSMDAPLLPKLVASKSTGGADPAGDGTLKQEAANQPFTQAEYGKVLFIAKGCVTCHFNPQIEPAFTPFRIDVGKNLSGYVATPEFLRMWLKDPKSVKPNTEMPNLELSEAEIEALIAFINPSTEVK